MSFNVKTYGAAGNCKYVVDGTTNSTNVLHSPSANWSSGDVGKVIWAADSDPTTALTGQTTITAFIDSTHVQIGVAAARTSLNVQITWGTDDTAAFQAAYTASRTDAASAIFSVGSFGTVFVPAGGYLVTGRFYGPTTGGLAFSLVGESKSNTIIFPSPACAIPGDLSGVWIDVIGGTGELRGFSIQGPDIYYALLGSGQALIRITQAIVDLDFKVTKIGSSTPAIDSVVSIESSGISGSLYIQNAGPDYAHAITNFIEGLYLTNCYGNLNDILVSNFLTNLSVDGCISRQGLNGTPQLCFFGGLIDEQLGSQSIRVVNGSEFSFLGTTLWAAGTYAATVDATSKMWLTDCDVGCYFLGNIGTKALQIVTGGVVTATGSTFRAVSTGSTVSIDNDGTFMDGGGNNALNGGTGTNVAVPWLQAFKNPTQILRR